MFLLPKPQKISVLPGHLCNRTMRVRNYVPEPRIDKALRKLPVDDAGVLFEVYEKNTGDCKEGYYLKIEETRITLIGESAKGVFYGIQTLRQLLEQDEIPCMEIEDAPGMEYRGFYHDITRGKVPKVETIKKMIDHMAYLKLNSLQLYIEHTFPFKELGNHIEKTGCLTTEEIQEIDDYCYENFIELIPSIATFGHLYELLQLEGYRDLQELEDYKETQIFWYERMEHHTIDPTKKRSFEIVKSLIDQMLPLFRTNKFNICCDETFDLKNGKHKNQDTGELYIDFVKKIIGYLESKGKTVMMWADILLQHPETISELPVNVEFLNWSYGANPPEEIFATFGKLDCIQIVCPGTSSWNGLVEGIHVGTQNILKLGDFGYKYHAKGMLNTNWGDYGNPCSLELAMHGLALGAAKSWNAKTSADTYFTDCINYLIYKNPDGVKYLTMLDEVSMDIPWKKLVWCYSNCIFEKQFEITYPEKEVILKAQEKCREIMDDLEVPQIKKDKDGYKVWEEDEYRQEMLLAAEGLLLMAEMYAKLAGYDIRRYTDAEAWLKKYRVKWMQKNKESELREIEKMFRELERS